MDIASFVLFGKLFQNIPILKSYIGAFFVFSMAVQTVMLIAAYFGEQEINWGSSSEKQIGLIVSITIIQLIAIVGANITARCSKQIRKSTSFNHFEFHLGKPMSICILRSIAHPILHCSWICWVVYGWYTILGSIDIFKIYPKNRLYYIIL